MDEQMWKGEEDESELGSEFGEEEEDYEDSDEDSDPEEVRVEKKSVIPFVSTVGGHGRFETICFQLFVRT